MSHASERVTDSIDLPETVQLRLLHVSVTPPFGNQALLQDISCEVTRGDRIAVVGPSGAGKTTLLRILNRLSEPTSGSIAFEGRDYRQIPVLELRQQIVLVLQESRLLGMSVREAIAYPLKLRGLKPPEIQQRLSEAIERLQLPKEWLDRTELQLSVGQRQLVALTRAIALQPKILLLDEPTSALDAGKSAHLLQVLDPAANPTMTVLMVNHHLELAQEFCTRVLHLQQGRLLQDAPSHQVNWSNLRQTLIDAQAQEAQEWQE